MNSKQMQAIQRYFAQQKQQESGLVEFKCGRCFMNSSTKMVTADDKRGTLKFYKNDTGFLQMDWVDRISKDKGLTLTLFPKTAKWERVDDCKDGKVYLLRLIDSNVKHFFWMQEPDDEDTNDNNNNNDNSDKGKKKPDKFQIWFEQINWLCEGKAVNDDDSKKNTPGMGGVNPLSGALTGNPAAGVGGVGGGVGGAFNNQMFVQQQQQILASLQGGGTGTGGTGTSSGNSNNTGGNNGANSITNMILQAMRGAGGNNNNTGNNNVNTNVVQQLQNELKEQAKNRAEQLKKEPDLEDILSPTVNKDEIIAVLDDEKVLESLAENLPEGMRTKEAIIEQLESPQFQGALRRLQSAINGPSMDMILMQMGIPQNNANNSQDNMGVSAFIEAIINKYGTSDAKNDDNDTNMDDQKENNPPNPSDTSNESGNNNDNNDSTGNDVEMSDVNKKPENPPNPGKKT